MNTTWSQPRKLPFGAQGTIYPGRLSPVAPSCTVVPQLPVLIKIRSRGMYSTVVPRTQQS